MRVQECSLIGPLSQELTQAMHRLPIVPRRLVQCLLNYRGQRKAYARELFYYAAGRFTPMLLSDIGPERYCVPTGDAFIGPSVFTSGAFDATYLPRVLHIMESLGMPSCAGKTFVDVGANVGTTTVPALLECGFAKAVAIEPEPFNFQLLRINLLLNQIEERVRCLNVALSDAPGHAAMKRSRSNCGDHRVLAGHPTGPTDTFNVCLTTFDSLTADGLLQLDDVGLVWMDTQGHEGHVLSGAPSLLASDVPVLAEFCPELLTQSGGIDLFLKVVADNYSDIVDIRTVDPSHRVQPLPARAIADLAAAYDGGEDTFTDVLLLKRS